MKRKDLFRLAKEGYGFNEDDVDDVLKIMETLNRIPRYEGYEFDYFRGIKKGPMNPSRFEGYKLSENEAIIWIKQPIPHMAQHNEVLIEREGDSWKYVKGLMIIEGETSREREIYRQRMYERSREKKE